MTSHFAILDWALVAAFLAFYAYLGIRAREHSSSVDEFLVMSRRLGTVWGVATLAATETGLITLIYFAEEAYLSGFVAFWLPVLAALTMFFVGWRGLVVKKLREMEVRTVPEYVERRFGAGVRSIAGLATFTVGLLNLGIFLQAESAFLAILMGIPESRILAVMAVMLVVVVTYTMLGGMYSVVLTDVVQFGMIVVGVAATTWAVVGNAGGWGGMVQAVRANYGSTGFNPFGSPRYGVMFLSFTVLYYLSGWSSWQPVVARVLSVRDTGTALRLYRISSLFMFMRAAFPMIWGIGALAIVGRQEQTSMAMANMMARILPAGIIGLVTVALLSASMSTYSSYLLAFSSILIEDVVRPRLKRELSDRERVRGIQAGVLLIGAFIYFWAAFYHFPESVFRYITVTGALSFAATLTVLAGGMYWKRATTRGACWAFAGSAIPPLICLASPALQATTAGILSFVLAAAGMAAGSLLTPKRAAADIVGT